ncbi:MAG: addiction module protein [Pirellulales bacterium]|nr:addiction module protein [Pirellulales bacterium]
MIMNKKSDQTVHKIESPPVVLTEQQQTELIRRFEAYKANQEDVLTWEQVLEQLRERLEYKL